MNPIEPAIPQGYKLKIIAKDQPQYFPLPAAVNAEGIVITEWEPTADELQILLEGGRVQLWVYTFGTPLQPVKLLTIK